MRLSTSLKRLGRPAAYGSAYHNGGRTLLALAATALGASAALWAIAAQDSPNRTITDSAPFEERANFDYSAMLGRGVYDGDELRTPQPLFRRLGEQLPFSYSYGVNAVSPSWPLTEPGGVYSMTAELTHANGWSRIVTLTPPSTFEGPSFKADGVLDVATFGALIRTLEVETGYKSPQFRVRLMAHVEFHGRMAGVQLSRVHDQALEFLMSDIEMRVDAKPSVIDYSQPGTVSFTATAPQMLSVPIVGSQIEYARLPEFSRDGLWLAGLLGALVAVCSLLAERPERRVGITSKYERLVTDVSGVDGGGGGRPGPVAVSDLDALFRLAESYQLPVLRTRTGGRDTYWLLADTTYAFDAEAAGSRAGPAPPSSLNPHSVDQQVDLRSPSTPRGSEGRPLSDAAPTPASSGPADRRPRHAWEVFARPRQAGADPSQPALRVLRTTEADEVHRPERDAALPVDVDAARAYWGDLWPQSEEGTKGEDAA